DVELRVGPRQAEVRATLELTAPGKDLSLLEWEVGPARALTVAGVTGPDVRGWSRSGNRVLVWLTRTTGKTTLELSGWLPLAGTTNQGMRLDLPALRPAPSAVPP